ncbi:uncharacterized protein PV09_07401 [Verruconis gallopava]|uniref:Orc1-like AAA ATPase domain-containing protein n=1 Tax=Verruconis gallopava TaxID=253628 RepID=A0A0D2A2X4_9PEZI|nr:uncharacterized protein PV09_07401 [Verruconis gallopava]KIW01113.1 hypothetical protein PV09_07401 [Verruconis gallopava]
MLGRHFVRGAFRAARYPTFGCGDAVISSSTNSGYRVASLRCAGAQELYPSRTFARTLINGIGPQAQDPDPNPVPGSDAAGEGENSGSSWKHTAWKMFESAATTAASISILGLVGYSYTLYYKRHVLKKMERAFEPGDPVLDIIGHGKRALPSTDVHDETQEDDHDHWILRHEQETFDKIISGQDRGNYHLLIGEKGTGKSSMILDSMSKINGEGVAMFEAHADLEIFRLRLGKALDFEFHEDNVGSLFSIRGPRDAGPLLDIERAFNKLDKVAIKRREKVGRPLVLIINSVHLLRDDEDGRDILELIQQRAEQWAASNLCTVILNSDDYWVYERLKNYGSRMKVHPIRDLPKGAAIAALKNYRKRYRGEDLDYSLLEKIYDKVGGRLTFLSRVARSRNMLETCEQIMQAEKTWFLNKCWILGSDMDDDVMDQQKYASAAMVLAKALVEKEKEMAVSYDPKLGHILPAIPLHEARQIMTRADFIQSYDHDNLFSIDADAMVRADSVPMMNAFREICAQEGFDQYLQDTLDRISDIESLGRTRELTIKDLWNGGKYNITTKDRKGVLDKTIVFEVEKKEDEEEKEG